MGLYLGDNVTWLERLKHIPIGNIHLLAAVWVSIEICVWCLEYEVELTQFKRLFLM